jgi:two-component sensor histidine kinase
LKNYSAIRLVFLMVCILTSVHTLLAQKSSIEKLKFKLESKKYSNYTRSYFADTLLLHYRKTNPDSALFFTRKMYSLVINDTSQNNIDYCVTHLGSLHRIIGNLDSSIFYYKIALNSYRKRKYEEGIASIYNNLATVYKTQNRYDLAILNYLEALEIFKNSKRYNARGNMYSNFAGLYFKLENYVKAKEYWQLAERDYRREKSHEISHCYRGYSRIFIAQKKYQEALEECNKAYDLDKKNKVDVFTIENLILIMEISLQLKEKNLFVKSLLEARTIIPMMDNPLTLSKFHEIVGDENKFKNQYEEAIQQYDSSLQYLQVEDLPENKLNILKKKLSALLLSGKDENNDKLWKEIQELEIHVLQIRRDRITQETDARYSLREKEEKIKILDEKNKVANELIESEKKLALQSKRQILWMWSGIGLILIFIIYVLFINKKLKSTQVELQKNIEQKDFLFRELNHRVKNNLHIVSSFLSIESNGKAEEVKEILHTCENRIHSLGLVHEMLYQGEFSENIELYTYFEKLLKVIRETLIDDKTKIDSTIEKGLKLSSNKTVLLGLIANELITNSIKYAKTPDRDLIIQLNIKSENGKSIMKIADNGIGITEKDLRKNSLGMKLAKGLTNQLGGEFSFENLEQGIEFTIQF